ncbi:hypothetical protein MG293_004801 [Ovis ammon polii]|uniref:Uncharacterized protein n=1 Tax=Ovis ammon polii TaxID=230172 RepID=A0AAD4UIZ0_OVIAM|nr:hypothetical protein MG293_004801 [Ovis ammon polii]
MEPGAQPSGAQPSRALGEGKAQPQQQGPTQCIEGHGQVVLLGELWKQDECCVTLQNILEQGPTDPPSRSSSIRATSGHSNSSNCARGRLKRSGESSWKQGADCPAAKSKRCSQKQPYEPCKARDAPKRQCEAAPAGTPGSGRAEDAAPGCRDPGRQRAAPESGARLLLVLCRASALRSQLPRLQLLLQQVSARERSPPAALFGLIVQPRREEEAEARLRMESLLCGAFARHSPAAEVHTAVFCPRRAEGTLDIQRAAGGAHRVASPGCVHLVDRATQTDGEGPEGGQGAGTPGGQVRPRGGKVQIQRESRPCWSQKGKS